jgi:hypothetical protein
MDRVEKALEGKSDKEIKNEIEKYFFENYANYETLKKLAAVNFGSSMAPIKMQHANKNENVYVDECYSKM